MGIEEIYDDLTFKLMGASRKQILSHVDYV